MQQDLNQKAFKNRNTVSLLVHFVTAVSVAFIYCITIIRHWISLFTPLFPLFLLLRVSSSEWSPACFPSGTLVLLLSQENCVYVAGKCCSVMPLLPSAGIRLQQHTRFRQSTHMKYKYIKIWIRISMKYTSVSMCIKYSFLFKAIYHVSCNLFDGSLSNAFAGLKMSWDRRMDIFLLIKFSNAIVHWIYSMVSYGIRQIWGWNYFPYQDTDLP